MICFFLFSFLLIKQSQSQGPIPVLTDFNNTTFSSLNSSKFKIFDGNWNQLNTSLVQVINLCSQMDLVGGITPTGTFVFGKSSTNSFQILTMYPQIANFPIYSIIIKCTLIYFASTGQTMTVYLNSTPPTGGSTTSFQQNVMFSPNVTNNSLACNTNERIYNQVIPISQSFLANYTFSISLVPTTTSGSFGFRDLVLEFSPCNSICLNCSSPLICTNCTTNAKLASGSCTCRSGFYWTSCVNTCQQECLPCPSNCTACTETGCTNCATGFLLTLDEKCESTCPDGSYQNGTSCQECSSPCLTCTTSATNCLSCNESWYLLNNSCVDNCPLNYYVENGQSTCNECNDSCSSCSQAASNCTLCSNGSAILFNGSCLFQCPSNYYFNGTTCVICNTLCATCQGSTSLDCITCPSLFFLYQNQCFGSCPLNTYQSSATQCSDCSNLCDGCTGPSASNCIKCKNGTYLDDSGCVYVCASPKISNTITGQCMAQCSVGSFLDPTTQQCLICDSNCEQCQNQSTLCISCFDNSSLYNNSCFSPCPNQTYQDSDINNCEICNPYCSKCQGPLFTDCLECADDRYFNQGECVDACPIGTYQYEVSKTCFVCDSSCKSCSGTSSNQCLSCSNSLNVLYQGVCNQTCPDAMFPNQNNGNLCQNCGSNCLKCTSLTSCQVCTNNYYLNSNCICNPIIGISFIVNETNNPSNFILTFTYSWDYLRANINDILAVSVIGETDMQISHLSIMNSSSSNNSFLLNLKYSKSFSSNLYSLFLNLTIDYSKTNYEYYLQKTNQTISLLQYYMCSDSEFYDPSNFNFF